MNPLVLKVCRFVLLELAAHALGLVILIVLLLVFAIAAGCLILL